jgi:preprotein translocase subunit YajC
MMLSFVTLLAQGDAPQQPQGGLLGNPMVMMVLMVVMFYFLLIRPQQRQRKELQKRIDALQKGDEVVTTAGIHAIVHNIKDRTVVLKVAEGVMMEFDKPAVATVLKKEASSAA